MSRAFNGSAQLENTSAIVTDYSFSAFCWAKVTTPSSGGYQSCWSLQSTTVAKETSQARFGCNATGAVFMVTGNDAAYTLDTSTTTLSATTWTPILAVWNTSTSRTLYVGTGATSSAFTGSQTLAASLNNTAIGYSRSASGSVQYWTGSLAHVAVWNTALTSGQASWLCAGGHPLLLRTNLVGYAPLTTNASPEPDWVWNKNYTVTSATYSTDDPNIGRALPSPPQRACQAVTRSATR